MTIDEVKAAINNGSMDSHVEDIMTLIRERRQVLGLKKLIDLKRGDKVKFIEGRPAYLIGQIATVRRINGKSVGIEFDDKPRAGRFGIGIVRCSPTMLQKVNP